ncbi:hypothetical protein MYX82_08090 [Acidobacteria bacterium AH-259-D05]|nr:hypothetical protein [Acidobacteria bacterium AH-259-D05]
MRTNTENLPPVGRFRASDYDKFIEVELGRLRQTIQEIQKQESLTYISPERWAEVVRKNHIAPLVEFNSTLYDRLSASMRLSKDQIARLLGLKVILPFTEQACKEQMVRYAMIDGLDYDQLYQQLNDELVSTAEWAYEAFSGEPLPELEAESERKVAQSPPEQTFLSDAEIERALAESQKILDRSARRRQEIDEALRKSKESRESSLEKTRAGIRSLSKRLQERREAQWEESDRRMEESDKRRGEIHELNKELLKQRIQSQREGPKGSRQEARQQQNPDPQAELDMTTGENEEQGAERPRMALKNLTLRNSEKDRVEN